MKRLTTATTTLFTAAIFAGCHNNQSSTDGSTANSPKPVAAPTAKPAPTDATLLKSGKAPMSYLLGPGGNIRVTDATTGKEIGKAMVPPQAAITLDPQKGLLVGTQTITAGPLPDGHNFEIWLDKK